MALNHAPGRFIMRRALALALCCLPLLAAAPAHSQEISELEAAVAPGSAITYLKLLRDVFKGARIDQDSGDLVTAAEKVLRRPGSKERTILPEGTPLGDFQALTVRGDGKQYLLLFFTAHTEATDVPGNDACILAVFPQGGAQAQDVVEVKTDQFCVLSQQGLPSLGPDEAFCVLNSHGNSNQAYQDAALFHIHDGRIRMAASVFTLSTQGLCKDSFREELAWASQPQEGSPYPRLTASVTLTQGPDDQERAGCPPPEQGRGQRVFTGVWAWDAAQGRYQEQGRGLEALGAFNEERF